jgi:uncharacterized protein (DUF58 family)
VFTKITVSYLSIFAALFIVGLLLTNPVFLYTSLVPLFFIIIGIILDGPKSIQISRREGKTSCFIGETIEIAIDVTINDGFGTLILRDSIPEYFELVEGNNFKVIWKGIKTKKETINYKVRCTKRGVYHFENLNWESRHALSLKQTISGNFAQRQTLVVRIRTIPIRKIRNLKTMTKLPLPIGSMSRTGISTTDFKEVREYYYGDPYRKINWKITARTASRSSIIPFVNEFEKEGKKFVWIFVDGSPAMGSHGNVISNAFEYSLDATNNLAQYYLERDCFVGVYLYNKNHRLLYPDLGRRQRFKIARELLQMDMDKEESLRESIRRCRSYLVGSNPLSIIITTLSQDRKYDIIDGIKELAKYSKKVTRSTTPILIINVVSYHFAAKTLEENMSANILQAKAYPIKNRLRKAGAIVVDWNPLEQSMVKVLLKEVGRR